MANGRVYVPTLSNAVVVYGTLSDTPPGDSAAISVGGEQREFLGGCGVAPGELVTIFGANLGPPAEARGAASGDYVADTVGIHAG